VTRAPTFPGYDAEAEFYDLCWSAMVEDIGFYQRRIGGADRILDLMCGTGRLTLAFARAGRVVDGVDESAGMLRVARSKLRSLPLSIRRRVRFHRANLIDFRLPSVFDAAVIPLNSFPLILSRHARVRALRNVRRHLSRSGKLLLQIDTPSSYESARAGVPMVNVFRLKDGRRWYFQSLAERFVRRDLVRGITTHLIVGRSGRILKQVTTETRTRVLSVTEVVRELREAGYSSSRLFWDYSGGRSTKDSSCAVIETCA